MKSAQILDYLGVGPIDPILAQVRPESTVCIVAAVTELLISGGDCGTIFSSIDPVLNSFYASLSGFSASRPDVQVKDQPHTLTSNLLRPTLFVRLLIHFLLLRQSFKIC